METVPVTRLDFTTVLPRFLSLYVLSFLNPRDLCAAAQVSWHWRFLAEQVSLEKKGLAPQMWVNIFSILVSRAGLSVDHEVCPERLVPSLQSRNQRIRSLEEPLHRLCLHAGLAAAAEGGHTLPVTAPAGRRDGGGGGEEAREEAEADDQSDNTGGEK